MLGKVMKRWIVVAVAVPVAAASARKVSQAMERRRGSTRTSRLLRRGADLLHVKGQRRRGVFSFR